MTAVEYLVSIVQSCIAPDYIPVEIIKQAKEIEKQQIIDAVLYGFREDAESFDWKGDKYNSEQYYNETFNKYPRLQG